MKRQTDTMIGDTVLWKVVSANFFFSPTSADLAAPLCAVFFGFLALLSLQQASAQDRKRSFLVFDLTATILTTHDGACRNVQYLHSRIGCVHALPTRTAGAGDFNSQLFRFQFKIYIFRLGQHRDCRSRCMNPTLRLGRGYTLHPVNAT